MEPNYGVSCMVEPMRTAICELCNHDIPVKPTGPLPKRCEACRAVHNRQWQQQHRQTLATKRAERQVNCVDCGVALPWAGVGRPRDRCTACLAEWTRTQASIRYREWREANPEQARATDRHQYEKRAEKVRQDKLNWHLRRKYGLERADYDRMVEEQGNRCKICGQEPSGAAHQEVLHVDHCHTSGRVRGLLCGNCNTMIGLAGEDPKVLMAAVEYLEKG